MNRVHSRAAGIIPACAGSTLNTSSPCSFARDHPRMRGEHYCLSSVYIGGIGSSPHARGARRGSRHGAHSAGIIPACAGSTPSGPSHGSWPGDHPRMRGEHDTRMLDWQASEGSSPHARGARTSGSMARSSSRIIPACAGSTTASGREWPTPRDHPRMRGEHRRSLRDMCQRGGSSPHARGALGGCTGHSCEPGIIPACAGSTGGCGSIAVRVWDHPRMRGEHPNFSDEVTEFGGSSPHARGAPRLMRRRRSAPRIIPACAGSTKITHLVGRYQ